MAKVNGHLEKCQCIHCQSLRDQGRGDTAQRFEAAFPTRAVGEFRRREAPRHDRNGVPKKG